MNRRMNKQSGWHTLNAIVFTSLLAYPCISFAGFIDHYKLPKEYREKVNAIKENYDKNLEEGRSNRPNDAFAFDCTAGKFIDSERASRIRNAQIVVNDLRVKKVFDADDSKQYLIFIATDGTGKNAETILGKDERGLVQYLRSMQKSRDECLRQEDQKSFENDIAKLKEKKDRIGVADQFPSNPGLLAWLLKKSSGEHVRVVYVHGVGADPHASWSVNTANAASGATLNKQIEDAYDEVRKELVAINKKDPKAKFVFVTTGFSRGAAAARVLNNRIMQAGIRNTEGGYIVEPGEAVIGASVLFDTVTTQMAGASSNKTGKGAEGDGASAAAINVHEYEVPKELVQVLHLTAENEYRVGFELRHARGGNVTEIPMPGAHSDIGGGYEFNGISAVTLEMAIGYLKRAGVPFKAMPKEFNPSESNYVIHDSRKRPQMAFETQLQQQRASN